MPRLPLVRPMRRVGKIRLNGWIRIGIVLSVSWMLYVSGFAIFEYIRHHPYDSSFIDWRGAKTGENYSSLVKTAGAFAELIPLSASLRLRWFMAALFAPIVLFWSSAFIIVYTVRWVAHGFGRSESLPDSLPPVVAKPMTNYCEHTADTYRSLISFSVECLKALLLVNGGAVVALLAYLGHSSHGAQLAFHFRCPLAAFVVGVASSALAFLPAYATQFALYNESVSAKTYKGPRHMTFLWVTFALVVVSFVAFGAGAFWSINALAAAQ
jgi:hypothetical protein